MYCVNDTNFEGVFRMQPHLSIMSIANDSVTYHILEDWIEEDGEYAQTRPFPFYWSDKDFYPEDSAGKIIWDYLAAHEAVGQRTYFIDNN